ncbi:MAG TPA: transcription antitermination factor NusB [Actinomycetes bacterium]|nr:transcription antitermination factor NusB [Actinomycetes bacterium]
MSRADAVKIDRPRQVSYDVVRAVSDRGSYANLLLPKSLVKVGLSGRDAAFATELTYGTLRWLGTYDAIIDRCVDRAVDPPVRDLLRLGAHQILAMDVPAHAAVSTTVDLANANGLRAAAGFVNAVLRRIAASSRASWLEQITSGMTADSDEKLGVEWGHPTWMVTALRRALLNTGRPERELVDLLRSDNEPAPVTLVARPGRSTVDELLAASRGGARGRWSPYAVTMQSGDPAAIAAVRERRAGVQDEGSQLVTLALSSVEIAGAGGVERWLDMCAGPGGKAALLAALASSRGAEIHAWEIQPHRAELVQRSVGPDVQVLTLDATSKEVIDRAAATFARVLLDAPCTGVGALRRRPEARWRKSPADLLQLGNVQRRLLAAATRLVRPGGVIGYVTCSPLVEETTDVVTEALAASDGRLRLLDARPLLPGKVPDVGEREFVQLWPHLHGTDAMFLAVLQRSELG